LAVDEIMVRYEGHAKEATTIPGKPTPTGFKVWAVADGGFLLCWNWHIPGAKNGPVGVKVPVALGGSKKAGKGGNKTQAVAISLVQRLPKPPSGHGYHCYLDNLFVSTRFVLYARSLSIGITGTCRDNSGIIQDLLDLKKSDKDDHIPWGETYSMPTLDGKVCHIGWKDQAFVLMMSSVMSGDAKVLSLRKRPKETSSKAKTSRIPFGGASEKELEIPKVANSYNYCMGAVDEFDHLTSQNAGLRHVERGGHQAIEHWLFRGILTNCYLLAKRSDAPLPREVNFRSQQDFRRQLVGALLAKGDDTYRSPKKRVAHVAFEADETSPELHQRIKMDKRGYCKACMGGRFSDRPKKRVALGEIAANTGRQTAKHQTIWGCKQCSIHLCKERPCFGLFHRE